MFSSSSVRESIPKTNCYSKGTERKLFAGNNGEKKEKESRLSIRWIEKKIWKYEYLEI